MNKDVGNGRSAELRCCKICIVSIGLNNIARAWQYRGHFHWLQAACGLSSLGGVGTTTVI
jgi:hypothetical protein